MKPNLKIQIAALMLVSATCFAASNSAKIKITGNSTWDETGIRFVTGATPGFDAMFDAWKLFSPSPNNPQVFTKISSTEFLSINSQPEFQNKQSVELPCRINVAGVYSFSMEEVDVFAPEVCIYMEDLQTGSLYDMRTGNSYNFNLATSNPATPARFVLHFNYPLQLTIFNATCSGNADGSVQISKPGESNFSYTIYDNSSMNIIASANNINEGDTVNNLAVGQYMIVTSVPAGCPESQNFSIGESAPVSAGFTTSDTTYYLSAATVLFTDNSQNASTYSWDFGDGSPTDNSQNPTHQYLIAGDYAVTETVFNGACYDVFSQTLHIVPDVATGIAAANENSANVYFDGSNLVIETELKDATISVMNSLGEVLQVASSRIIHLNENTNGYYLVRIEANGFNTCKKIAVVR